MGDEKNTSATATTAALTESTLNKYKELNMIGYKAFNENLQCRGFQFEVGKTYDTGAKEDLKLCSDKVFHFCRELHRIENVSDYCISKSRICEVIAEGNIITDGDKFGTNKLFILREVPRDELNEYNSRNSGFRNSGNYCSGDWNSGDCNSGDCNSGNRNSGNYCSGDWNSGNYNSGFFNTNSPLVRIFNKETNVPRSDIDFPSFLYFDLTVWVSRDRATDEEREAHKRDIETCGGFTKAISYKEAFQNAWNKASLEEHKKLLKLPNWDNEIFKKISGIDAEAEIAKECRGMK